MQTVNHLINVTHSDSDVKKISGIDVSIRPERISIWRAYAAFENTKQLLLREISAFISEIELQLNRAKQIRETSHEVPEKSAMICTWLDKSVEPTLTEVRKRSTSLHAELLAIPKIEDSLQRDLKNITDESM